MQRFVLLATVASAQTQTCDLTISETPNLADPIACQQFSTANAPSLTAPDGDTAGFVADGVVCAPVCGGDNNYVPKAATWADYTCAQPAAIADFQCVAGCPAQGPVVPTDLTRSDTQGFCGTGAAATNWVAVDGTCTNQCDEDNVAFPKQFECEEAGQLEEYHCIAPTMCVVQNNSATAAARGETACDDDSDQKVHVYPDSVVGILAVDAVCEFQCPSGYRVSGDTTSVTCGTSTDFNTAQDNVNTFTCVAEDSDTGSASSVSLAVSVLAVLKAAFA